ncbi:MAG: FtsX-like permease family protein [Pseudomonadota bacterium]
MLNRAELAAAWTLARKELSAGLRGFWVYMACLAVGAYAISAAGSVTAGFDEGLKAQSRQLLGGDVAFVAAQRLANPSEREFLDTIGVVSETAELDVMGAAGEVRRQVDVHAVDTAYPLISAPSLVDSSGLTITKPLQTVLIQNENGWGIAASRTTLDTFKLSIGDVITLGQVRAEVRAILVAEPDELGEAGTFGPRVLISIEAFKEAGRLTNGQLFRSSYRVLLSNGAADLPKIKAEAKSLWGDAGLRMRAPEDAVDGLSEILQMLNAFLAVIGIAALAAGGVGVAQATQSFLSTRIPSIAAFKALGAESNIIQAIYAIQLGAIAMIGAGVGVALGALTPLLLEAVAGDLIPLPQRISFHPGPALQAFLLSVLAATVFAAPAIGRARATPPAALFRTDAEQQTTPTPRFERVVSLLAALALISLATITSPRPLVTIGLLVGASIAYFILTFAAHGVRAIARNGSKRSTGVTRIALANLSGPQSLAPVIAPALGLGLALLTLVAAVQENLIRQIETTAPANAPSLVFTQIPNQSVGAFDQLISRFDIDTDNKETYRRAPIALARVVGIKGEPVNPENIPSSERWAVESEIALTYLTEKPPEAEIVEGDWWPATYRADAENPLLLSVEADAARGLGLSIGDIVDFSVFGRSITAQVSSLRRVDWAGFGANITFILSPGLLEAANPQHFAIARAPAASESDVIAALEERFPDVVIFQTREALAAAASILGDISIAVNAAAGIVTLSGLLVLSGAFASMARERRSEAALLKVFGAQRSAIITLYAVEFAFAGAVAAGLGAAMGVAAATPIVINVFEASWTTPWGSIATAASIAIVAAATGGAIVGANALSEKPAQALRAS